jgi:tetratricopeptide (TPR) repeat protein
LIFIPLSTLLSKEKVKFTYFQVYAFAVLAAIFAGVLALRDFIVPIAALLILPTYFVLALTNRQALKEQVNNLFRSAQQNSIIRENTGIIYPFIPTSIMARLAYLLAAVYIVSSTLLLHPYILLLNAALLLVALLFFRVGFLRLVPLLAAIVTGYLLFHNIPNTYIIISLLYAAILAYTAVACIKKDYIATAIILFPFTGLQIIYFDGASILMLASLVIYCRTQKAVWLYAMVGIAAVVNLSTLIASFINFKPEAYLNMVRYGGQLLGIGLLGFILLKQREGMLKSIAGLTLVLLLIIYGLFTFQVTKKLPVTNIKSEQATLTGTADYTAKTFEQKSAERNLEFPELPIGLSPTPSIRFGTAATIFTQYLKLITIAYPLSYYYGFAVVKPTPLHATAALVGIGLFALLSIAVLFFFRRNLLISIGIAFFLITVFPFLDIIIPLPGMMADRFLLIPSIGFCIAIAGALHYFIKEGQHPLSGIRSLVALPIAPKAVLLIMALIYSGISIARNEQWENHLVLFKHDIEHLDESTQAHNLLALQYTIYSFDQKDLAIQLEYRQNAEKHFKRAIEIYPQFFNPHFDLARLNELMNRPDSALKYYQKTITIDSTFPTPYLNASRISQSKNDLRASVGWLQHGLRFDTLDMEWYNLLSYDLYRLNDYQGSAEINKLAMRRIGVTADLMAHVGQAYLSATELDSARVYLEKANAMNPNVQGLQGALQQLNNLQKQTPAK